MLCPKAAGSCRSTMRRCLPGIFLAVLSLFCLPALSQENVIRIAVPLLQSGTKEVSPATGQERLVKSLTQHKPDKKFHSPVQAVALASEWGTRALTEAREKKCDFVLSVRVGNLRTDSELSNNGAAGMYDVPVFRAAVEYRITRVIDGAGIAIGSLAEEDLNSLGTAVDRAISKIAGAALDELAKGGNVPHSSPSADALAGGAASGEIGVRPCIWLPDNIPHADKLRGVCEYALSLTERMPNFICNQEASRFRGKNTVPFDQITALVRYEDGKESFEEIKLNGKPTPEATTQTPGLWSTGEFGSNLRSVFDPWNQPSFTFDKENKLNDRTVWGFRYRIPRQNDPLWRLHGGRGVLAPPYEGELWVDQITGDLVRFTSVATNIPPSFPMTSAELRIDYSNVPFADGSSFVLPADFTLTTAVRAEEPTRNVVQFRGCHKFRAKAQIVLNVPKTPAESAFEASESASAAAERELSENENLYAILREQAIREDNASIDAERRLEMNVATVAALSRLARLDKVREKRVEQVAAKASSPAGNQSPKIETTLKVSVRLVPVPVVLRDSKGNAVGNFRKEDFTLFDNGAPQPIKSFVVEQSKSLSTPTRALQRAETDSTQPVVNENSAPVRYVAYLFDDIHTSFEDLASARDAARHRVNAMRSEDRIAIVTTSGQVFQDFTPDRGKLDQALQNLRPHPIKHGNLCPPISPYMADLIVNQDDREALGLATRDAMNCAFAGMPMSDRAEQIAKSVAFEVLSASNAEGQPVMGGLRNLVQQMGHMPGSRSIVMISPGFLTPEVATRQEVIDLIDSALRSEIVVNTLDARGLYTPVASPDASHPANPVVRFKYDREESSSQSEILANLAYSTGGTFFHNNNDLEEGFRRTAEAPEYVYVLGFSPSKLDGKYHKLKIRLNTPAKLIIQAREGYYALKPAPEPAKPVNPQ